MTCNDFPYLNEELLIFPHVATDFQNKHQFGGRNPTLLDTKWRKIMVNWFIFHFSLIYTKFQL